MSELTTNLNNILSIKGDIKTAIESKGVDMTGVSFSGYADKIGEIETKSDMFGVFYDLSTVTEIHSGAFSQSNNPLNSYITTVNLPNCTSIGDYAFYNCTNLSELSLPLCTYIGDSTFRGTNITSLNLPVCSHIGYIAFAICNNLSQVSLPVCEYIGSGALRGTNITTLTLPECKSIGVFALSIPTLKDLVIETSTMCTLLSSRAIIGSSDLSIYVPASLVNTYQTDSEWSYFSSKIFPIQDGPSLSFDNVTGLLSGYCYSIYSEDFNSFLSDNNIDRASITQVSLPLLRYIGGFSTFAGCSNLISVSLPVCESVGANAFESCTYLSDVYIPNCTTVETAAFRYCEVLQNISLPVCSYIGNQAFRSAKIYSIVLGSTSVCSLIGSNTFTDTPIAYGTGSIYVPASLVDAYKANSKWSGYSSQIFPIE